MSGDFFPNLLFFLTRKTGKAGNQDILPNFGNLTVGEKFGRLRIPIFGKKRGKIRNTKISAETKSGNLGKKSFHKNGLKCGTRLLQRNLG